MGGGGAGFGGANFSDIFGDVFSDFFGGGRGGSRGGAQRGGDLRYTLELNLEEAVRGTTVSIRVPTLVNCKPCDGSGAKKVDPVGLPNLWRHRSGAHAAGLLLGAANLPALPWPRQDHHRSLHRLSWRGRVEEYKTLSVKVPAGVDTGDRIRLSGEGEAGTHGGPTGDLYVVISVREHAIFQRDGKHLYCEVPISYTDAALGGELEVPTLDGRVKLKIPEGTQTGKQFRLRGKGVAPVRGGGLATCCAEWLWRPRSTSVDVSASCSRSCATRCRATAPFAQGQWLVRGCEALLRRSLTRNRLCDVLR